MNIRTALNRCMAARVMRVLRLQPNTIVIIFYDLREAIMSANWLDGKTISELNGGDARLKPAANGTLGSHLADTSSAERELPLSVEFITRAKLEKVRYWICFISSSPTHLFRSVRYAPRSS